MSRNFFRRIELAIPVEDGVLRERLISEVLAIMLADNRKARFLQADGSYRRAAQVQGGEPSRSQVRFMALAQAEENAPRKPVDGKAKYPQVTTIADQRMQNMPMEIVDDHFYVNPARLAPSPFAAPKRKKLL